MQTLSHDWLFPVAPERRLSWRVLAGALHGNALAAFPEEAFREDVVVQNFLGRRHLLLQCPEAIRDVLVDNPQNYLRSSAATRVLRPMFGGGLFFAAGEEWRRQRREAAPAFAPRAVRMLAGHVVTAADRLAEQLGALGGEPMNLIPVFQRLALDIIGSTIFSLDMQNYGFELRELILRYAARLGRPSLADFLLPLGVMTPSDVGRLYFRRRWRRLIDRIIADRHARPSEDAPRDLFDILAADDPGCGAAAERLGDQLATIVVAGHETTAAAMFWTMYLLAQHPDEQEKVAAEAASFSLSPDDAAETLPLLTRTRAVVDESLRLYPPAFVIVRQAIENDLADNVPVKKGSLVLIAPWVLHRHRRFWSAPERFEPARFLPGAPQPSRFVYMPFGAGPRTCIGSPFALTELVLVVARLVRGFRVGLASDRRVTPVGLVTIQPDSPPVFRLTPRGFDPDGG